jgi:hypothetical protein
MSAIAKTIPVELDLRAGQTVVILGGHYCINPELTHLSEDGVAELASFEAAVQLYVHVKTHQPDVFARLVLWVNDIGIDQAARTQLKQTYRLPQGYLDRLRQHEVMEDEVVVEFESAIRNKASTNIRQIHKLNPSLFTLVDSSEQGMERCIEKELCDLSAPAPVTCYTITGPNERPLVLKEGPHPKCNLILASLYHKYSKGHEINPVIVNIFNGIYKNRIRLGMFVYRQVYKGASSFSNFFTTQDGKVHAESC